MTASAVALEIATIQQLPSASSSTLAPSASSGSLLGSSLMVDC